MDGWEISLPESGAPDILGVTSVAVGQDYDVVFKSALAFQREGNYREAIADYTRVIEMEPEEAGAYINRGAAYESMGKLDLALQDLDTALSKGAWAEAYYIRGHIHFNRGDFDRAALDFSEAIGLDPNTANAYTASAYTYRGHSYQSMACHDHAIRDYHKALTLDPKRASLYVSIGTAYAFLGEYGLAIEQYDKALELNPNDARIHTARGDSHRLANALDRAMEDLDKALALDRGCVDAYIVRGTVRKERGDTAGAIRDFDTAIASQTEYAHPYAARGSLYLAKGDLERAAQDFSRALELDPSDSNTYNERGVVYELMDDLDRAMEDYNKALCLRPNMVAFFNRGIRLLQLGEWERARSDLLSSRNMGFNLVSAFRYGYESVVEFEGKHTVKLPADIGEMLTIEEEIPGDAGASILAMLEELRKSIPDSAFDAVPSDWSQNYKHYLYGEPKR